MPLLSPRNVRLRSWKEVEVDKRRDKQNYRLCYIISLVLLSLYFNFNFNFNFLLNLAFFSVLSKFYFFFYHSSASVYRPNTPVPTPPCHRDMPAPAATVQW